MTEIFMRHYYGASGYVDPHEAYEKAYREFGEYWSTEPDHLRNDQRFRAIAAQAFLAAKGFELGGSRRQS